MERYIAYVTERTFRDPTAKYGTRFAEKKDRPSTLSPLREIEYAMNQLNKQSHQMPKPAYHAERRRLRLVLQELKSTKWKEVF